MTLKAALDALRTDAASWDRVAEVTGRAGFEAGNLTLGAEDLSWASLPSGLLDTYTELQDKVVRLLDEATGVYRDLSVTLDRVTHAYEVDDEKAARRFEGVWDVRD
ncbi:hypothetical protein [Actinoplanes aureus]|uniref:Excreted virulence factor EspC (Type VII ESX diderm) n=1 Tax=Actinoplanes aureus TaxID=2792083 RepID=A0A931CBI4_9ACTN|nr:hypothetical protein [Actinoplanes aureus]MBG0564098.1 hypothetical protein [Actinoplanes aureus]